jgi:hypothetical protein
MARRTIDDDLVLALHWRRGRYLRSLIRERARKEWERCQEQGVLPGTIKDKATDTAHWLIVEGLTTGLELAACGLNVGVVDYDGDGYDGRILCTDVRPLTCPRCRDLLARVQRVEAPAQRR